ncbi:MAG: 30S ribosomal protein S5 [Candidatus Saganbacteria bacterium]|nr:30S ribosomal protein S5 [Candidatus Saganbacteria bacterium]
MAEEKGFERRREEESDIKEKVIQIRRVTKVVKGGKRMGFRVAVVVGDLKGKVGFGMGKAAEVSAAIRKGVEEARKSIIQVRIEGSTISHQVMGKCGASDVLLRPAAKGRGIIAGGAVRTIVELSGIKDLVSKSLGSPNAINVAKATIDGLSQLKSVDEEIELRGKNLRIRNPK